MLLPFVARLGARLPNGTRVRAILQDEPDAAADLVGALEAPLPTLLDRSPYELGKRLNLVTVPTLFEIDAAGVVRRVVEGFDRGALERLAQGLGVEGPLVDPDEDVPLLRPG